MSQPPFNPFEAQLDRDAALSILRDAVAGADDGELFFERRRSEGLVFDDGRLKTASYDASEGFGLRAVRGDVSGYAHSTEITEAALRRASETARLAVGAGGGTWADAPAATNQKLYTDEDPIAGAAFPVKVDTLREIDDFARSLDARVVQVSASISASIQEVEILRPEGTSVRDVRPMTRVNVSVIVEQDGRRESGTAGGGGRVGWTDCWTPPTGRPKRAKPCASPASTCVPCPRLRASWMLCLAPAGPASCCTRPSVTDWKEISTARAQAPLPDSWANASPPKA